MGEEMLELLTRSKSLDKALTQSQRRIKRAKPIGLDQYQQYQRALGRVTAGYLSSNGSWAASFLTNMVAT
jgi:hypothetical protein